ncbi:TIGR02391 family protein [Actinoplanes sp. NPDC024001]|uniref:TIGR02391 family protein n=1 Tax=Actinoplanes sp. NPDC024001 TaxID=3154598 RepID=UPI0034009C18
MTASHAGVQPWPAEVVTAVADIVAATDWPGLSGADIERLLQQAGIPPVIGVNKRSGLAAALLDQQRREGPGVAERFLAAAMSPARHLRDPRRFEELRTSLAEPLSLLGLQVTEQGRLGAATAVATTLDEVARIAGRLRSELQRRGVHDEVLRYCEEELIRRSLFHAVFEATKGVSQRLRILSGRHSDGAPLVDECLSPVRGAPPLLRINRYVTESETSEQRGFANLVKGIFGTFRNPPAHTTRADTSWDLTEADALDLFSMLSFVHRRLDGATATPRR